MYYSKLCILRKAFASFAILFGSIPSLGQTKTIEKTITASDISVLVVDAGGETRIRQMDLQTIELQATLSISGKVYGFKLGETERPPFEFDTSKSRDTLYVKMPSKFNYSTIGANFYRETIQNQLLIPKNIKVIVRQAEELALSDDINYLEIKKADKVELKNTDFESYSVLYCEPKIQLKIDEKRLPAFMRKGEGHKVLMIKADYINIISKQL